MQTPHRILLLVRLLDARRNHLELRGALDSCDPARCVGAIRGTEQQLILLQCNASNCLPRSVN